MSLNGANNTAPSPAPLATPFFATKDKQAPISQTWTAFFNGLSASGPTAQGVTIAGTPVKYGPNAQQSTSDSKGDDLSVNMFVSPAAGNTTNMLDGGSHPLSAFYPSLAAAAGLSVSLGAHR